MAGLSATVATVPVDHLVLGAPDLAAAAAEFAARTGVTPAPGGRHPRFGTHNALVALGGASYLELLAPDPDGGPLGGLGALVRTLTETRLVTFAAAVDDAESVAAAAAAAGLEAAISDGARRTPSGGDLAWRNVVLSGHPYGPLVPFFIEWRPGTTHPASTSPPGCRLLALEVRHPDPAGLADLLAALGLDHPVAGAGAARLTALLDTPRGHVVID